MPGTANEVIALSKRAAKEYPNSWDAQNLAANISESIANYDEAIKYREAMLKLDPNNWQPWYNYAKDLENKKDIARAKSAYQKVIKLGPGSIESDSATVALRSLG